MDSLSANPELQATKKSCIGTPALIKAKVMAFKATHSMLPSSYKTTMFMSISELGISFNTIIY